MIDYTSIQSTLTLLDTEYGRASSVDLMALYSKLAVLEFAGWIEESFDTLCNDYIANCITEADNQRRINAIIKHVYGFTYDTNVYPMMCSVLGINNWENILDAFPAADFNNMTAVLGSYTSIRNQAAHKNSIPGVATTFNAPSVTIADYNRMKPAMVYLEGAIGAL